MYGTLNLGTQISTNKPVKQDYSIPQDEKGGTGDGIGSIIYNRDDYMQSYEGKFVCNNMHGYGEYQWQPLNCKHEGMFYVNRKEGYGCFSFPTGAYFEGLYRNDQRFGPGVYTDAAGFQDVGIWIASKLIRLSRIFEPDQIMPRLAITDENKIRILRYREIIHLEKDEIKRVAENLFESLTHSRNYDTSVLARAEELYSRLCSDERSPLFNKPRYDGMFFGHELDQLTIDVLMTEEEIHQEIVAEKGEALEEKLSPKMVYPEMRESKTIHEMYNPSGNLIDEQFITEISQPSVDEEVLENEKEEIESDYCGINQIDPESIHDTLALGNHEKQWNIFQSSAITIPQDFPEKSDVNSTKEEDLQGSNEVTIFQEDFDDFGRKKIVGTRYTKKVVVTELMAWNNSPISIELLKHVFKHRNFEKKLSFDISRILAGRRGFFRQEGTHEKAALELLQACYNGCQNTIPKLISRQNLDVDVADSRGNSGILLAAARDRVEVIDTLLNLGADVDSMNDECLTPLALCILRLLALIHGVTDWSNAFLPTTIIAESKDDDKFKVFKNTEQWHGRISYESLVQQLPKRMNWNPLCSKSNSVESESTINGNAMDEGLGLVSHQFNRERVQTESKFTEKVEKRSDIQHNETGLGEAEAQKYIFDMSPIIGTSNFRRKSKTEKSKNRYNKTGVQPTTDKTREGRTTSFKNKKLLEDVEEMQHNHNIEVSAKKEEIYTTILRLLRRGADPNFAQVPYPVLIMAIFTQMPSLVSELLEHGADPDTTLSKEDNCLTPLLILAVLQPASEHALMAKALLQAKADPSRRADPDYRPDLKECLNQNRLPKIVENSEGITALHLLAIRPDMDTDVHGHLVELIKIICQYGYIKESHLYYGHSPLSLAIFEGNLTAVKTFLETKCVNANEQLGTDLGNAMFMLVSCTLQQLLPPDLLQNLLELLLEYGGCPFASAKVFAEDYNQIEYGRKELIKISRPPEVKLEAKQKRKKIKSNQIKDPKLSGAMNFSKSMDFVEKIAKEKLIDGIKASFVRDLMESPIMLFSAEKQSEFLKEPIFRDALAWMTGEDVAIIMRTMNYNRANTRQLVRLFVTACVTSHRETLSNTHRIIRNETERIINKVMPLTESKKQTKTATDFEDKRFNVCFECLNVHGKILILCPKCKRVYFCSQECNLKCTMQKINLHRCSVFYQKEWLRLEKIAKSTDYDPINFMLKRFKNPGVYMDLENNIGLHMESRGKKISKNHELLKCWDEDSPLYREYGGDEIVGENKNQHAYKDNGQHAKKNERQKRNEILGTENDNDDMEFNEQRENRMFSGGDKKSRSEKANHLFDNREDTNHNIGSKYTDKKGDKFATISEQEDASSKIKSKKVITKSYESAKEKDKKANRSNTKWKDGKKSRYAHTVIEVEPTDGNKTKLKEEKKADEIEEYNSNSLNIKKGKKKGSELGDKEANVDSKIKSKDNHWRRGEAEQGLRDVHERKGEKITDNILETKQGMKRGKQEWKTELNKKPREMKLNELSERYINKKYYSKTNVPEKYLDWLLKISRSAGDHLDLDMLLLPYVVFAQGDTYFRILPANQYPKFAGNYSLI